MHKSGKTDRCECFVLHELEYESSAEGGFRLSQLHLGVRTLCGWGWEVGDRARSGVGSNWPAAAARVGSLQAREALVSWLFRVPCRMPRPCLPTPPPLSLHPPPTPFSPYFSLLSLALLFFTPFSLVMHFFSLPFLIALSHFFHSFSLAPPSLLTPSLFLVSVTFSLILLFFAYPLHSPSLAPAVFLPLLQAHLIFLWFTSF
jgi:hypothetical protein